MEKSVSTLDKIFDDTVKGLKKHYGHMKKQGLLLDYRITPEKRSKRIFVDVQCSRPLEYLELTIKETP